VAGQKPASDKSEQTIKNRALGVTQTASSNSDKGSCVPLSSLRRLSIQLLPSALRRISSAL
jgi:hypothetical protein